MPATSLLLLAGLLAVLPAMVLPIIGIARRSPRARFRRRLRALDERLAARGAPEGTDGATRRRLIQSKLREMENQRNRGRRNTVHHLIAQSGLPIGLKQLVLGSIAAALIAALLTTLIGAALPVRLIAALGAGLAVPRAVLKVVIKRRQAAFTEHFAD